MEATCSPVDCKIFKAHRPTELRHQCSFSLHESLWLSITSPNGKYIENKSVLNKQLNQI